MVVGLETGKWIKTVPDFKDPAVKSIKWKDKWSITSWHAGVAHTPFQD